jgi:DNA helicase-2/ATP-dependent DNA helicase PcrA
MVAGVIDPLALLHIEHLVVDEFQDLNPLDLQFVREMSTHGVTVFVAGDDDQSIYSFRYADPSGIQNFPVTYAGAGLHALDACFRCPPAILDTSTALIGNFADPNRIPKNHHSLYVGAAPVVNGTVHRWRFANHTEEGRCIAESCRDLIAAGMNPRDILILVGNLRSVGLPIRNALQDLGIDFEHPREESFLDSEAGRLVFSMARIVNEPQDYVAHRTILGQRNGTGISTCRRIGDDVIANGLNFRNIFYNPLPSGVFTGHRLTAMNRASAICATIAAWNPADTIDMREAEIGQIVETNFDAAARNTWDAFRAGLPGAMTLEELRDYFWTAGDDQEAALLVSVLTRLGQPIPAAGVVPARVRIMTMHGAKGLSARAVFVPGLEEQVFPGAWRVPFPGLILEAARLLYVSITRARAACMISYASRRVMNGVMQNQTASRYAQHLNGAFGARGNGLTAAEIGQIMTDCGNL